MKYFNLLYAAWMKPGLVAIKNIKANVIAREVLRSAHTIVATTKTFMSSLSEMEAKLMLWPTVTSHLTQAMFKLQGESKHLL